MRHCLQEKWQMANWSAPIMAGVFMGPVNWRIFLMHRMSTRRIVGFGTMPVWSRMAMSGYFPVLVSDCQRTPYLSLPEGFSRRYFPAPDMPTPKPQKRIMDKLAVRYSGGDYRAESGVIHFSIFRDRLREEWMALEDGKCQKPDVALFYSVTPAAPSGAAACAILWGGIPARA
jgi:hypothetical protein